VGLRREALCFIRRGIPLGNGDFPDGFQAENIDFHSEKVTEEEDKTKIRRRRIQRGRRKLLSVLANRKFSKSPKFTKSHKFGDMTI
jgi:hypothetical protein